MKNLKKITILIIICLIIGTVFSACGKSETKKFLGSWKTSIDISNQINEGFLNSYEGISDYVNVKDMSVYLIYTFKDDGTYSVSVEQESSKASFDNMRKELEAGFEKYFENLLKEQNLSMTVDEFLETSNTSIDALLEQYIGTDVYNDMVESLELSGKWKAENGKLYSSDSTDLEVDETEYITYEIDSEVLKLLEVYINGSVETEGNWMYPLTFNKIQ